MKTIMYLAATLMLFFSCSNSNKQAKTNIVSSVYGTSSNVQMFHRDNGDQALKVEVATNVMLDSIHPNISTAQIALLSYRNLNEEERTTIKSIDVIFVKNEGKVESYTYQLETFPEISSKFEVFNQLSQLIVDKKYEALDAARDTTDIPKGIGAALNQKIKFLENNYGKLKGFKTFGLAEQGDALGRAYQFQGYLEFEKRDVPYFFYLDTSLGKDQWLGFHVDN